MRKEKNIYMEAFQSIGQKLLEAQEKKDLSKISVVFNEEYKCCQSLPNVAKKKKLT